MTPGRRLDGSSCLSGLVLADLALGALRARHMQLSSTAGWHTTLAAFSSSRGCRPHWKGFVLENGGRTLFRTLPYGRRTIQAWLWIERGAITQIDLEFFDRYSPDWNAG